jgi:dimethylargininase
VNKAAARRAGGIVAIVRPPTRALTRCELTHLARVPIDVDRALAQHAGYVEALRALGATVVSLPPEPDLPDAVFVEDVAIVLDEVAVMTNPGAESRRAEATSVAQRLEAYRPLEWMQPPATLDGGDVLRIERTLYVGRSTRTNDAGIEQLRAILTPHRYAVRAVRVRDCLHLKSAASHLGGGALLANTDWVDPTAFDVQEIIEVDAAEPRGANSFPVGETLVMSDAYPKTRQRLAARGYAVRAVALDELHKAEAGGSCMSLVFADLGGD